MSPLATLKNPAAKGVAARLSVVVTVVVFGSLLIVTGSKAAFSAKTTNGSSTWATGTVALSDDDAESVMFTMPGLSGGDTASKCINVSYSGSLSADVKLYGTVAGSGLAPYLDTTIEIGTGAAGGATGSCTGFAATSTLFDAKTLEQFGTSHSSFLNGLGGFSAATNPTTRSYRISVTVLDDPLAQGKTATATFTWEAQDQ